MDIERNSITKSLSETASIELVVGAVKFSSFVVDCLSIGNAVPANAAWAETQLRVGVVHARDELAGGSLH